MKSGTGQAAWIRGAYAGGEPMEFAKVRIMGPAGQTHQVGNADALGRFAWLPDCSGPWQVVMDDGMGHRGELTIGADQTGALQPAPAEGNLCDAPLLHRVVWGGAAIFWISGLAFWWSGSGRHRRVEPKE